MYTTTATINKQIDANDDIRQAKNCNFSSIFILSTEHGIIEYSIAAN